MQKHIKVIILFAISWALFVYWAVLIAINVRDEMINYWWQAFLAVAALLYAGFGIMSAKGWHFTKSSMGKSVLAMSIGLLMWGLGQAVWTFEVIRDPSIQSPPGHLLDVLYSSAMIFWAYGIVKLANASGAKYGIKSVRSKIIVAVIILVLWTISYVILVDVVRGGLSYFQNNDKSFWAKFFDLSYAAGDVINLTIALVIFSASWKYLGGIFKRPIIVMLSAFFLLYMADFWFSYVDGKNQYYNGDWVDLLFLLTITAFGLGLCLLDPSGYRLGKNADSKLAANKGQEVTSVAAVPILSTEPLGPTGATEPDNSSAQQVSAQAEVPAATESATSEASTEPVSTPTEPALPSAEDAAQSTSVSQETEAARETENSSLTPHETVTPTAIEESITQTITVANNSGSEQNKNEGGQS